MTANRLTDIDRETIRRVATAGHHEIPAATASQLAALGWSAIGSNDWTLRDAERDEIDDIVREVLR